MTPTSRPEITAPLTASEHAAIASLVQHSLDVINCNQAESGAYAASPTFRVYRYCWFRDGAFIADAMSRAGQAASADAFFGWCSRVMISRAAQVESLLARRARNERIAAAEFLPCRYTLDGEDAGADWWEFQLDGYGTWLWSLGRHAERTGAPPDAYATAVELTVSYLTTFWDEPCYDWWEENPDRRHTSTLAAIYGGLEAATEWSNLSSAARASAGRVTREIRARILDEAVYDGHLVKWLDGHDLDASLIACSTPFRLLSAKDPLMVATVEALEAGLAHRGVHRYAADSFYGGGEWILLAALLGWHYAETGRLDDAYAQLRWIAEQSEPNGDLPEQMSTHLLSPSQYEPWLERWGPVATPLLWSHAMFITLVHELGLLEQPAAGTP